jgi:Mor family transcriptional regulator
MEKNQAVPKTTVTEGMEIAIAQRYVAGEDVESIARSFKIYANRVRRILNKNRHIRVLPRNVKPVN